VGAVTLTIAAGTGTSKVRSLVSAPLLGSASIQGRQSGRIASVGASTLSSTGAAWLPGGLSIPSAPFIIRLTSGLAEGRTFLISSQSEDSADTVTIDSGDASFVNLNSLGIVANAQNGDTFSIHPCDTLSSLLGDPVSTGVQGGPTASASDTVVISNTFGIAQTFYFNSNLARWTRQTLGNPDASNFPIRPDSGILYLRLGNSPITLLLIGEVPTTDRVALVKSSGVTYLTNPWPVVQNLNSFGIQNIAGWLSGGSAAFADVVTIGNSNYFYDGTAWRRQTLGSPIANPQIEVGSSLMINKKGVSNSVTLINQILPYSLN